MWLSKPPAGIQLNRNHPLAQGLVGCWLFNEGAGLRANDLTGNNNTGILTNFEPMSSTSGWTGGNTGTTLKFDGIDDQINCGNNPSLNISNEITVEGWIKQNNAILGRIISKRQLGDFSGYVLDININIPRFLIGNGIVNVAATSAITINTNTWYHLVGVFNGKINIIYVNGINQGTNNVTTLATNSRSMRIAADSDGLNLFNGIIDKVRVWNRALNFQEVQQLYTQPYTMFLNPSEKIRKIYYNEAQI